MIQWVDQCDSTQDELMAAAPSVSAVATLHQRQGRGRRGKLWQSSRGASLALSWRAPVSHLNIESLPLISLAAGVALYRWISKLCLAESVSLSRLEQLYLKWPNDLLYAQKKCAGILCEGRIDDQGHSVIVGIGINLNPHPMFPINSSSLTEIMDHRQKFDFSEEYMNKMTALLINELETSVNELATGKTQLLADWQAFSLPIGTILQAARHQGTYLGIDPQGSLLLDIGERVISVEGGEVNLISILPTH